MVAEVAEIPVAAMLVITGAEDVPPVHVKTVIEYGGNDRAAAGSKLVRVLTTGEITSAFSFVSVMLADVNKVTRTVPEGEFAPVKVTGRVAVRCKLNTTSDEVDPLEKA